MSEPDDDEDSLASALDSALEIDGLGGFSPITGGVGMPEPVPEATPATMVCLRGPCRHLYEAQQFFGAGNPKGTPGVKNVAITRFCMIPRGNPIDLTDECVYSCNQWDPGNDPKREQRRQEWLDANPDFQEPKKEKNNGSA